MPAFRTGHPRVSLIMTANHVLPAGDQDLSWDAAEWDDVGLWDGATAITVDRPGLWQIHSSVARASTGTSAAVSARISINAVVMQTIVGAPTGNALNVGVTLLAQLAAGDVIRTNVRLNGTVATTLNAASTRLQVVRIGPKSWR